MKYLECEDIYAHVQKLIRTYRTRDPFELCDYLSIVLHGAHHNRAPGMKGFFTVMAGKYCIIYDKDQPDPIQRAVIAHELGHCILNPTELNQFFTNGLGSRISGMECEANLFACDLLIDDNDFMEQARYGMTSEQMASLFEVPREYIILKSRSLEQRGYPLHSIPELPDPNFLH